MTFLNNTNTTVLPDFQYLTSPSGEQPQLTAQVPKATTTSHIPIYPIPKPVECNQYGNNITSNNQPTSNQVRKERY